MGLPRTARVAFVAAILLLWTPVATAGIAHELSADPRPADGAANEPVATGNVTLVTTSGAEFDPNGALFVVDSRTGEVLGRHDRFADYYDVDPLGNGSVLVVVNTEVTPGSPTWGVIMDWRTGEIRERFRLPYDTHDVDVLAPDRFAVADIRNDRVFVYNSTTDSRTWTWDITEERVEGEVHGGPPGWTHLNDVDPVYGGSAFLVSPRNQDQVLLIDRASGEVEWRLGREDDHRILFEQHNPDLVSGDPPTVLVADSENHRVIEYRRANGSWERTWTYHGDLNWPRDADRLPGGNTLIVDTRDDEVLEVAPNRTVVWRFRHRSMKHPYDAERLPHDDGSDGPTMYAQRGRFDPVEPHRTPEGVTGRLAAGYRYVYDLSQWVLPSWVGQGEFGGLALGFLLWTGWIAVEVGPWRPRRPASVPPEPRVREREPPPGRSDGDDLPAGGDDASRQP